MTIRTGIVGGAGYTAGELLRLLCVHPDVKVAFVNSTSNAGKQIGEVHTGLEEVPITFTSEMPLDTIDVLFLCSAHGESSKFMATHDIPSDVKVIDLAQDFRDEHDGFVYGLPELQRDLVIGSTRVANPGCFATAIQLSLLPLAAAGMLKGDINVTGVTGSTGAGVKPGSTTHFSWRTDNLSVYKAFEHQHLAEIKRSLTKLQSQLDAEINFVPVRGDFARGIFAMTWLRSDLGINEAFLLYKGYYSSAPFVYVSDRAINLKQAVNTNRAVIALEKHDDRLLITCAIDNLLKGASGQAVQNMNLMFGLEETTGLQLKPSVF